MKIGAQRRQKPETVVYRKCWDLCKRYLVAHLALGFTVNETLGGLMQQYGGHFATFGLSDDTLPGFRKYLSKIGYDKRRCGVLPSRLDARLQLEHETWITDAAARAVERQRLYRRWKESRPELAAMLLAQQDRQQVSTPAEVPGDVSTFFADIVRERDGAES